MKEFIIEQKDSGQRIDKYLLRILPQASKSFLYKMMRKKNIVINDKKIDGNELIKAGDSVKIWFSDETFSKFAVSSSDAIDTKQYINAYNSIHNIEIIYEDDNFAILNKPAGVLSQKADNNTLSINEWFIGYLLNSNSISPDSLAVSKPSIVNRLDRNTAGIVLAGKTVYGLNTLGKLVKNRDLKKYYICYVLGILEGEALLSGYHIKDEINNKVTIITEEQFKLLDIEKQNLYSKVQTKYKSIETHKLDTASKSFDVTKLEIDLITGKSHQIRAHLASIGHGLIGDDKYGNRELNKSLNLKHQLLYAYKVIFPVDDNLGALSGKEIICQHLNQEDFEAHFSKN